MGETKVLSRRKFLRAAALTAAGAAAVACQPQTVIVEKEKVVKETVQVEVEKEVTKVVEVEKEVTKVVEKEVTKVIEVEKLITPTALPSQFNESPVTAALVAEGKLPNVDERLPTEPLAIFPYDEIGQYGGTIRTGSLGASFYDGDCDLVTGRNQSLLRITPDLRGAVPNVLKDWSVSADFKVITCFMRKGMKWSDGAPLTSDDWMFLWEDVLLNTEITPTLSLQFQAGGTPGVCEKLDDYTFRLTFATPKPSFVMLSMAHVYGLWSDNFLPSHYLRQFHKKYNPKADDLAKEAKRDFWYQNFGDKRNVGLNMEVPKTRAYSPADETPERVFLERNPYFFIIDNEGNQLPYIDNATLERAPDLSLHNARIVGGSYDFAGFDTNIQNYKTYSDAAQQGGYRVALWRSGKGSDVVYQFNCNFGLQSKNAEPQPPDPTRDMMREIFTDDRFRQALSLAINRDEVNEILYFGRGTSGQLTMIPDSRHYKPEYATAFAQYDPDRANALLDELGLKWDADQVRRQWPDGTPIIISWDLYESETPKGPTTELIKEYWMNVGVEIAYKSITRTLLTQKMFANEEPISVWHGDETTDVLGLSRPKFFVPAWNDGTCWGLLWGRWYDTNGEDGVDPPQYIRDLYDWLDRYLENYLAPAGDEWAAKILASQAEHIWSIGVVGNAPHPLVVSEKLSNFTEDGYWVWDSLWTWPIYPEQWFYKG